MRGIVAGLIAASLAVWAGPAGAGLSLDRVILRAVSQPTAELTDKIARGAVPTSLDKARYPDLGSFTAAEVIKVLCGDLQPAYWTAFLDLNNQPNLALDDRLEGHKPYDLKWPACVYSAPNPAYVVKKNDNPSTIYKALTGKTGTKDAVRAFFGKTYTSLQVGQVVPVGRVTAPTPVAVVSPDLKATLDRLAALEPKLSNPKVRQVAPTAPKARILVAANYSAGMTSIPTPPECVEANPLSDADRSHLAEIARTRIAKAYQRARGQLRVAGVSREPVEIMVVDNGYLGVELGENGPRFRPKFPKDFFAKNYDGFVGPTLQIGGPVNPWIEPPSTPNDVAGHGTHVTGLVLGGPPFISQLATLVADGDDGATLLKVAEVNVGNGQEALLPGSSRELRTALGLSGFRVVNISLEYQDDASESVQTDFKVIFTIPTGPQKLFVVAAGNDGEPVSARYPAAFGGLNRDNVITVGATRPDGSLAGFSNWGNLVDIAAPGCALASSIDENYRLAPMSGTSQAAPQVSFAAALLHTLGNLPAPDIKTRLLISGDLLVSPSPAEKDGRRDPQTIASRSALNLERALYLYDDYLMLNDGRVFLGELKDVSGLSCKTGAVRTPYTQHDLLAFKRDNATGGWVFTTGTNSSLAGSCPWDRTGKAKIAFAPVNRVTDAGPGPLGPGDPALIKDLDLAGVQYLVVRRSLKVVGG